ncbi:hypothetical protein TELCIR_07085, partial [Teladorsagia circumcincta]
LEIFFRDTIPRLKLQPKLQWTAVLLLIQTFRLVFNKTYYGISRSRARFRVDAIVEAAKNWWSQVKLVDGIGMRVTYREKHQHSSIRWFTRKTVETFGMLPATITQAAILSATLSTRKACRALTALLGTSAVQAYFAKALLAFDRVLKSSLNE